MARLAPDPAIAGDGHRRAKPLAKLPKDDASAAPREGKDMKIVMVVAATAALAACSGQGSGNRSGNPAAPAANAVSANATSANSAAATPTGAPAEAYRRYFDERWSRGGAAVTPAEVSAMLKNQTPQQTVNALYGSGENSRWDTVASGIAKGDPAWLATRDCRWNDRISGRRLSPVPCN